MLEKLRTPIKAWHLLLLSGAVLIAVTSYCLAYTRLSGRAEAPQDALIWTLVNVLPWLAAFEIGKRGRRLGTMVLIIGAALSLSLALNVLLGTGGEFGFELVRRIPGLLITASLLAAIALPAREQSASAAAEPKQLPLTPEQIDWVAAAGNYVELHGRGRTILHRAPLSSLEAMLSPHGFVRVHRSTLVRRDRIKQVRPVDIILHDGTSLRTGTRYRALLHAQNFVPSSHSAGGLRARGP